MEDTMTEHPSDNGATLAGYTKELIAVGGGYDLHLLVKPDADLDGTFRAFCTDEQEYIRVNGWLFAFRDVPDCEATS